MIRGTQPAKFTLVLPQFNQDVYSENPYKKGDSIFTKIQKYFKNCNAYVPEYDKSGLDWLFAHLHNCSVEYNNAADSKFYENRKTDKALDFYYNNKFTLG